MQNSLRDVYAAMEIATPGSLGALSLFNHNYLVPISKGLQSTSSKQDILQMGKKITTLRHLVHKCSFRTAQVDSVSTIQDYILFLHPNEIQLKFYKKLLADVNNTADPSCQKQQNVFQVGTLCRGSLDHPNQCPDGKLDGKNGVKLEMVHQIISTATAKNDKIVIFVSRIVAMDEIETFFITRHPTLKYSCIRGSKTSLQRKKSIDEFNTSETVRVIIITIDSGSEGINLSGGNVVILYNTDWNPFKEYQAINRLNRFAKS